jgi:hypothetical protein
MNYLDSCALIALILSIELSRLTSLKEVKFLKLPLNESYYYYNLIYINIISTAAMQEILSRYIRVYFSLVIHLGHKLPLAKVRLYASLLEAFFLNVD